jgi:hypothetical protein
MRPINKDIVGISSKFFVFNAGVHLSEGTFQKIFNNLTPDECAAECLKSAGQCPDNIRCLSFDFYPYENPKLGPPWMETGDSGVCVLNTENKDSARLRNSDLGYVFTLLCLTTPHARARSQLLGRFLVLPLPLFLSPIPRQRRVL